MSHPNKTPWFIKLDFCGIRIFALLWGSLSNRGEKANVTAPQEKRCLTAEGQQAEMGGKWNNRGGGLILNDPRLGKITCL